MSKVATQCTNMKFTFTTWNALEMEGNCKIILLKSDLSTKYAFFSVYSEVKRKSIEIGRFAKFLAKLLLNIFICHILKALWSEKINSFLIVNKRAKVVFEISLWYKGNY